MLQMVTNAAITLFNETIRARGTYIKKRLVAYFELKMHKIVNFLIFWCMNDKDNTLSLKKFLHP